MEEPPYVQSILNKLSSSMPLCRVCLEISAEYIEFEGALCVLNGQEITYSDGFNEICSPICDLPDRLPTNFCVTCGNDLLNAYLFIKRVENANFILSKVREFTEESTEFVEQKDEEYFSEVELDMQENLKVESFADTQENELSKLDNSKSLLALENVSVKMENEQDYALDCGMMDEDGDENIVMANDPISYLEEESQIFINTAMRSSDEGEISHTLDKTEKVTVTTNVLIENCKKYKSEDSMYMCIHCNKVFPTADGLEHHQLLHEYSKPFVNDSEKLILQCSLCEKHCRTEAAFLDHINAHTGSKPYSCKICSNEFHTKQNLSLHNWRVHLSRDLKKKNGKEYEKCSHCGKIVRKSHMDKHLAVHSSTKNFICHVCEKEFATKLGLKAHSVVHREREFACNVCDKICLTEFTLQKHVQYMHMSERKKYQCEDCGLVFQYPSYLKDHQRKHNVQNRFNCPHCDRSYCRKPQLDIHMRYHTNDFRYKCDQCDKGYVTKSNLQDHIRSAHTKITYDCDKCDQKFKSVTGLRKHKYAHTGYPYNCPLCSVGQTSRSGMKAHLFGVHKDAVTEEEFNEMFPIIIPKTGYRRPREFNKELI